MHIINQPPLTLPQTHISNVTTATTISLTSKSMSSSPLSEIPAHELASADDSLCAAIARKEISRSRKSDNWILVIGKLEKEDRELRDEWAGLAMDSRG
jgi:hypothetical protein